MADTGRHQFEGGMSETAIGSTAGGFLTYFSFNYQALDLPKAPSGKLVAVNGIRSQLLTGQPAFLPLHEDVKCFGICILQLPLQVMVLTSPCS